MSNVLNRKGTNTLLQKSFHIQAHMVYSQGLTKLWVLKWKCGLNRLSLIRVFLTLGSEQTMATYLWLCEDIINPETRECLLGMGMVISPDQIAFVVDKFGIDNVKAIFAQNQIEAKHIADVLYKQNEMGNAWITNPLIGVCGAVALSDCGAAVTHW